MKYVQLTLLGSLLAFAASASAEQEITFRVPVNLQNLHPEIANVSVQCRVTPTNAHGRMDLPVVNRAFNRTVEVRVKVTDGQSAVAEGYRCELHLFSAAGEGVAPSQDPSASAYAKAKLGTPFVQFVEGPLPKPGSVRSSPAQPIPSTPQMPPLRPPR